LSFVEQLTAEERELARRCVAYVVDSRELDDELETRLGVTRAEAAEVFMR
jgi:hypothetical protein